MNGKTLFLASVFLVILFLVGRAGVQLWGFMRLNGEAPVTIERWEVERLGIDKYGLVAHYTFFYGGALHSASSHWAGKRFLNRSAAEAKIVSLKDRSLVAYFPSVHPSEARLERRFPLKGSIYALIAVGVGLYFLVLLSFSKASIH